MESQERRNLTLVKRRRRRRDFYPLRTILCDLPYVHCTPKLRDFYAKPSQVIIAAAIAAPEALTYLRIHLPDTVKIYVGAIDDELTAQSYIVPGLGDAGDLAYGEKL